MSELEAAAEKPVCYTGMIGDRKVGKTTLLSAITKVLAETGGAAFRTVPELDDQKGAIERGEAPLGMFVQYETAERAYLHTDIPGPGPVRFDSYRWSEIDSDHNATLRLRGARDMHGAILVVSAREGLADNDSLVLARQAVIRRILVFINRMDELDSRADRYMLENVIEPAIRVRLSGEGYGASVPIVHGSALAALEERDAEIGRDAILKLLRAMDAYLPIATASQAELGFPPP